MKKVFLQYAGYNVWANRCLANSISKLTDEQLHQEINSSFKSIYLTVIHLWDAESIWWQRIKLKEQIEVPGASFKGSFPELASQLLQQSQKWSAWVEQATENALEHEFIYRNSKKEQFKQPVHEVLHHLFNHQSYHRGQLITMLRIVGVESIPNTDLITYLRK